MSLDETLQRLQDAAWEHVASLPDTGTLSNEHLAGWMQVARAARPLLNTLERPDVMQSLQRAAAAIPARPAQGATPSPHLSEIASALRDVQEQLPADTVARQNASDVVALVIQSTARTTAAEARDSGNPQVRAVSAELEMTAQHAHETVSADLAQSVATPPTTQDRDQSAPNLSRPAVRQDDPKRSGPAQSGPAARL